MSALDDVDAAPAGTAPHTTPVPRTVLVTLLLASTLTIMAGATISPSLPEMARHFAGVPEADLLVRLVLTVTALAIAVCAPVVGVLVDRWGRRPVLAGAIVLYAVGGGSGLVLDDLYAILAGRVLLGVAVAGVMTAATALLVDLHGGTDRSRVLGLQAATIGAGGVVFLTVGGLLADIDWRGPFAIYLTALPLAVLVWRGVVDPPRRATDGPSVGESSGQGSHGALPLVAGVCALAFVIQVVFYTVPTLLPFYLADVARIGATGAGLSIGAMVAVSAVVSWNYARVRRLLGHAQVAVTSLALLAAGMTGLGLASDATLILPALLLTGAGVGLVIPNLSAWLGSAAAPAYRGRVLGAMVSLMFLGQFCSPLLAQPVVTAGGIDAAYLTAGTVAALAALGTAVAVARARPARGALVVVDMQNAFVDPRGVLAVAHAADVVRAVNGWVDTAVRKGQPVFYTRDVAPTELPAGDPDRPTDLYPGLDVRGRVVDKGPGRLGGFSGFVLSGAHTDGGGPGDGGLSRLEPLLREHRVGHLTIVGLAADVCVAATARDARRLGYQVTIPLAATAFVHAHPEGDDAAVAELVAAGVVVDETAAALRR